ncbi:MAG: MFS transporter [Microbacteriaceae bacterium]|nr:MFS transporter [Microbacteriaceae bacterium]
MSQPSPARTRLALFALALGGFGIGSTEFVAMGLLPNIARELLPKLAAVSPEAANAQAGWLIAAYALGVVVGAPTIAIFAARFARKRLLLILVAAFTVGSLASAVLPSFGWVFAARFVAALPHGAYFGIASLVAAELMGPGKRAKGVAAVLFGLTIANVIGVPSITFIGQVTNWRVAYFVVAGLFALAFAAIAVLVPFQEGDRTATVARELQAFGRIQVWLALLIGAMGFGGFFAVYTYISPMVTEVTQRGIAFVPIVLVVIGLGLTLGNALGGFFADRNVMGSIFGFFGVYLASLIALALTAHTVVGLLVCTFVLGTAAAALSPAIQTRLMDVAGDSQTIAAALNHAAFNIGNGLGAFLGGVTVAAGFGYVAPTWIGALLCVPGILLAITSLMVQRRSQRHLSLAA